MAQNIDTHKADIKPTEKNPIALREEEILRFWKEQEIFKKTLEKNTSFFFVSLPPYFHSFFRNCILCFARSSVFYFTTILDSFCANNHHYFPVANCIFLSSENFRKNRKCHAF